MDISTDTFFTVLATVKPFKTVMPTEDRVREMLKFFGIDYEEIVECPVCKVKVKMRSMLPHLNNDENDCFDVDGKIRVFPNHNWTFKQLGEWLESLGH